MFNIQEHVEFDNSGRAVCPSCAQDGKTKKKNLALIPDTDGAYKCHRGCTPDDIRTALGTPKAAQVAKSQNEPVKRVTVNPQTIQKAHQRLLAHQAALTWLSDRGIGSNLVDRHRLGLTTAKVGRRKVEAITIPIPANPDRTAYYQKKRVAPWDKAIRESDGYQPWKQYGIPAMVFFAHKPEQAETTWLCEGEWDALMLGALVRDKGLPVAVATFTCGCRSVPPAEQLARLPGPVYIWYDLNDKPLKDGSLPGVEGAKATAKRLGERALIAEVPAATTQVSAVPHGYDVSDSINAGAQIADFIRAASLAKPPTKEKGPNALREALRWNDDLITHAPEYTEFIVPDLLTEDEMFILAAPPRVGKTLLAMTLAQAVASGGKFMGRPCTQGTVLYIKSEDSDTKIKERQEAQGWNEGLPVAWLDKFKLRDVHQLDELVDELDPRLIIIDTLSRAKDGSISETSAEMSQLLEPLQDMANRRGCCVVLVHHTGKINADTSTREDIFDNIRGSSSIRGVCRGAMVLAKGDTSYRLVVENGWGKHDLRVSLDKNTLQWNLLGEWKPVVNQSQQEQIIAVLQLVDRASVDFIHERTGIKRNSIYKQLTRLMDSSIASEKVIKEGSKRNYTYRLALVDTIGQLEVLSTNCPLDQIQLPKGIQTLSGQNQKNIEDVEKFGFSTSDSVPVENPKSKSKILPYTHTLLSTNDTPNPIQSGDLPSGQLVDSSGLRTSSSTIGNTDILSSSVPVENINGVENDPLLIADKISTTGKASDFSSIAQYLIGDVVRYVGTKATLSRVCGRKHLKVIRTKDDWFEVQHKDWAITQTIHASNLTLVRRAEE